MSIESKLTTEPDHPAIYQIRIAGHLGDQWQDWFGGLSISLEVNGETLLTGLVMDQAALHGLLKKVRNLGAPLVSVVRLEAGPTDGPDVTAGASRRGERPNSGAGTGGSGR